MNRKIIIKDCYGWDSKRIPNSTIVLESGAELSVQGCVWKEIEVEIGKNASFNITHCAGIGLKIKSSGTIYATYSSFQYMEVDGGEIFLDVTYAGSLITSSCFASLTNSHHAELSARDSYLIGFAQIDYVTDRGGCDFDMAGPGTPPKVGEFVMWKKVRAGQGSAIVKLLVPASAKRVGIGSVRVNKAMVCGIWDMESGKPLNEAKSFYDNNFVYRVGGVILVDDFDDNQSTLGKGIHGFISEDAAKEFEW